MAFERIIGQPAVKEILKRALERHRLPHALLFYGPEGVGKEAMAFELAKALLCENPHDVEPCNRCRDCQRISQLSHPDVHFIFPAPLSIKDEEYQEILRRKAADPYAAIALWANPTISIEQIRQLRRVSALTSFEGKAKVAILSQAHQMTAEASNALLKILEEPPGRMFLILTTPRSNQLLPTIISRCQKVRFHPLPDEDIEAALQTRKGVEPQRATLVARLAEGNYCRALELLEEDLATQREHVLDFVRRSLGDDLDGIRVVDDWLAEFDKKTIKDLLKLMALWFRDVWVVEKSQRVDAIVNIDAVDLLKQFAASFSAVRWEGVLQSVEKSIDLVDRNAYIQLVLLELGLQLRRYMRFSHV